MRHPYPADLLGKLRIDLQVSRDPFHLMSLVHPLHDLSDHLQQIFFIRYGDRMLVSLHPASPVLALCPGFPAVSGRLMGYVDPFHAPFSILYIKHCHCDILIESPPSAAARIEPETSVLHFLKILMGMPEYDDLPVRELLRKLLFIVHHIEIHSCQRELQMMRQMLCPLLVVVSPHDIERCARL